MFVCYHRQPGLSGFSLEYPATPSSNGMGEGEGKSGGREIYRVAKRR